MKKIFTILAIGVFFSCNNHKDNETKYIFKNEYRADVNGLLPEGNSKVDIMEVKYPEDYEQLVLKFKDGIAANQEWFMTYQKENYVPGVGLPYHENFGVSKDEYEKMKKNKGQIKLGKIADAEFLIKKNGEIITISAQAKLSAFNGIKMNLDSNIVYINNVKVPYIGISDIKDTSNVIGKWKGHRWKLEENENPNYKTVNEISGRFYEFTIGQSEKDKRTFIYLKKQKILNGQSIENVDLQVFLN